jgi:hypothetical protein
VKQETLITIKGKRQADERRKGHVVPPRFRDELARRGGDPLIIFYDLGQVNHQDLNDPPVWVDHPILKTPSFSYSTVPGGGFPPRFSGVRLELDPFVNSDYQDYTDMMFNYPVTEWNKRYRKIIDGSADFTRDFDTDLRVSMRHEFATLAEGAFLPINSIKKSELGETYAGTKQANLDTYRWTWDRDRNGVIAASSLPDLTVNLNPFNPNTSLNTIAGYFSLSTSLWETYKYLYKVTATYDPNAPDIGTNINEQSAIEVYMMPQMGMWAATSQTDNIPGTGDYRTTQVLGPVYQIHPRQHWPRYLEDPLTVGTGGEYGSDIRVSAFLDYQKARPGMQGWTWTWTGVSQTDFSHTTDTLDPGDWSTLDQFGAATIPGNFGAAKIFYSCFARGGNTNANFQFLSTLFSPTASTFWGGRMFRGDEPFLLAVIKTGGTFYYVWDVFAEGEGYTLASLETSQQTIRYRLSRGIDWNPTCVGGLPLQPQDGTGPFFFT